jgi:hypothetical protein
VFHGSSDLENFYRLVDNFFLLFWVTDSDADGGLAFWERNGYLVCFIALSIGITISRMSVTWFSIKRVKISTKSKFLGVATSLVAVYQHDCVSY